jgi:hypothetical protein
MELDWHGVTLVLSTYVLLLAHDPSHKPVRSALLPAYPKSPSAEAGTTTRHCYIHHSTKKPPKGSPRSLSWALSTFAALVKLMENISRISLHSSVAPDRTRRKTDADGWMLLLIISSKKRRTDGRASGARSAERGNARICLGKE